MDDMTRAFACIGKARHETPKAAAVHLKRRDGKRMNVYKCKYCGFYHIGHKPQRKATAK